MPLQVDRKAEFTPSETIAVAIVVGAFSGLLGSVAGPYLGYHLDRRRRRQLRQEERQRELRQMLEALMRLARAQQTMLSEYRLARTLGEHLDELRLSHLQYIRELELKYPYFFWRPSRVKDERLRVLAMDLHDALTQSALLWIDLRYVPIVEEAAEWDQRVDQAKKRIDGALENVDQRLDELDW